MKSQKKTAPVTINYEGWSTISPTRENNDVLVPYFPPGKIAEEFTTQIIPRKPKKPATGWCSWYAFGCNINEENILRNARWMADHHDQLPLDYVIIDDGWTTYGDWQEPSKKKFPHGLKFIADEIKKLGLKPGLWFSPFLVDLRSQLLKNHPSWLLKTKGRPVLAINPYQNFLPNFLLPKSYLLDTEIKDAYQYLLESLDIMTKDWGFELLKIDFLTAIYLDPRLPNETWAKHKIEKLFEHVRKNNPQVYLMSGVVPMNVSLEEADSVRISDDIIVPQLDNLWPINSFVHTKRLRQLDQNLKDRKKLKKYVDLDPDVFVCRQSTGFSDRQIKKLLQIHKDTHGTIILGDDLPSLKPWQIKKYLEPLFG